MTRTKYLIKSNKWVFFLLLIVFAGFSIFLRVKALNAPFHPFHYTYDILPHLKSSPLDILFSEYHRMINVYRNLVSNLLYQYFGISEITHRIFSFIISLGTLLAIYRFTREHFGYHEAAVAMLLFGSSYYSLYWLINPEFAGFYMFASFISFCLLWEAFKSNKLQTWIAFAVINLMNMTNCLVAGMYQPALVICAAILIFFEWKEKSECSFALKSKIRRFLLSLCVSVAVTLVMYAVRGLNLLKQAFNILFLKKVDVKLVGDTAKHYQITDTMDQFPTFFQDVFLRLNFGVEWIISNEIQQKLQFTQWSFFAFWLMGLWALFQRKRRLFWCFMAVFFIPFLLFGLVFKIFVDKILSFIIPFQLIIIALGFVYLFSYLHVLRRLKTVETPIILLLAFSLFAGWLHPLPLWSSRSHDEMFSMYGIRAITDHLKENIRSNDVILNLTDQVRLENFGGGNISFVENKFYLKPFFGKHHLERLLERTGQVGIWVILREPIKNEKLLPYYFPRGYLPNLVKKVNGFALYYGQLDLAATDDVDQDKVFSTPFWLFMKAFYFQKRRKLVHAEQYYLKMIEYGFNIDRAYYNLGLLQYPFGNLDKGIFHLRKAVGEIQTPTTLPENAAVGSVSILIVSDERKLPVPFKGLPKGLRYYYVEKDGEQYKAFYKEDFLMHGAAKPYSEYYLASCMFLSVKYLSTKDPGFLKEAQSYCSNVLVLNLNSRGKKFIKSVLDGGKIISGPVLTLGNLNYIREEFPHVKYE